VRYLEFASNKAEKGLSPWAAERVAQSLAPWLGLDLALLFGIIIPLSGYLAGIAYNSHGLFLSLLVLVSASTFAGIVRGLIYARIGLPEKPGFPYLRLAEKLAGNTHNPSSKTL
ncbi:hypothetical protein, partial [Thermococcus sp.]